MPHNKREILCKKCMKIKSMRKKFKAKDCHSRISSKGITGRRKNGKIQRRTLFFRKQPIGRPHPKSVIYLVNRKRFREDSPEHQQSPCEKGECKCSLLSNCASKAAKKTPKNGTLKVNVSSTEIIEHYLNPALNQVPSSVEELAACFGKERDVFVPEKFRGSVYRIAAPKTVDERKRSKKIRFEIPEGTLGYEDAKKAMWRTKENENGNANVNASRHVPLKTVPTRHPTVFQKNPHESHTKSIRPKIPVVEKLKREEDAAESELDFKAITRYVQEQNKKERKEKKRPRSCQKNRKKMEKLYSNGNATTKKEPEDDCEYEFSRY